MGEVSLMYASFLTVAQSASFQICEHQCRYRPIRHILFHLFLLLMFTTPNDVFSAVTETYRKDLGGTN